MLLKTLEKSFNSLGNILCFEVSVLFTQHKLPLYIVTYLFHSSHCRFLQLNTEIEFHLLDANEELLNVLYVLLNVFIISFLKFNYKYKKLFKKLRFSQ